MSYLSSLFARLKSPPVPPAATPAPIPAPAPVPPMKISESALAELGEAPRSPVFVAPPIAPGVLPEGKKAMALDAQVGSVYGWANGANTTFSEGIQYMGFQYLAELSQRAEYRRPSEILAKNMTRKWLKIHATGEGEDKAAKIKAIEEEFKRLDVQNVIRKAVEMDGIFGRAQIYVDLGVTLDQRDEINKPIAMTSTKVPKDSLKRLTLIEPLWTYPNNYNSTDPLSPTFYHPTSWFVMGTDVHASRLLTVIGRPLPDILKPAYAFGGLSLSQMAKPYVDNWLRTRQAVADLLVSFTTFVLKTDMGVVLNEGAATQLKRRTMLFNKVRDNRGLFVLDKDREEFENVSAPLGGLDALQAQTQEHMSAVCGIPLSILLGITPQGLNASNEGEIRTFYDWIEAEQESKLTPHVQYILNLVQLSKLGAIDPGIGFSWNPLWTMSDKERGEINKQEAETDAIYFDMGTLDSEEIRTRLANKEDSPYAGLDLSKVIEQPGEQVDAGAGGADDGAMDTEFNEADHPRGNGGQFGSGTAPATKAKKPPITLPEGATRRRIVDPLDGPHTEVTLANGKVLRVQKQTAGSTGGLGGWHDMDTKSRYSYIADTEEEAIKALAKQYVGGGA